MGNRPDETNMRPNKPVKKTPNIPTGFPGQIGLLAKQMNSGFGGGLLAQRGYLNNFYSPMKPQTIPTLGQDGEVDKPTTPGTADTFELAPGMERWQRMLYAMPNSQGMLQQLQEYFQKSGYLK